MMVKKFATEREAYQRLNEIRVGVNFTSAESMASALAELDELRNEDGARHLSDVIGDLAQAITYLQKVQASFDERGAEFKKQQLLSRTLGSMGWRVNEAWYSKRKKNPPSGWQTQ